MKASSSPTCPFVFVLALAETPAVDRQRHQAVFHAHRRIGRLHVDSAKQLLLAQVVHAAVPVDVQQTRSGRRALVWNQEQCGDRLDAVQVQDEPLERVAIVLLRGETLRGSRRVLPRQVAEERPQLLAPALLELRERLVGIDAL